MILAKNSYKIVNFLLRSLKPYNVNQIANKLKISVGSAHKILKALEKKSIVNSNRMGNAIYYSLNLNNNEAVKLAELVLIENKNNVLSKNRIAKVYANDLEKFKAKLIILFGSILFKKGKARDVDALFIIKNKEQVKDVNKFCLEISKIRPKKVNPLIMLEIDFVNNIKKENKAVLDLIKYAIILKGEEIFLKSFKNDSYGKRS